MSMRRRRGDAPDAESAELAALADGSLAAERRAALEARVAASSELAERLREQQQAVALARSATNGVEAPAALRSRIEAQRRVRAVRLPRRPVLVAAAASAAVAVAVGVVVVSRSEEHTSELQSRGHLVCRLLLEKKKHRTT